MGRRRHSSVSGFPHACLSIRMPYTATHSPLLEPDVQISRIRLSRGLSPQAFARSCRLLLGLLAQLLSQEREFLRQLPPAAPLRQPLAPLPVFRSGSFTVQAALPLSDSACPRQGPFAPRALPRFSATMGLSDSRPAPPLQLCFPAGRWACPTLPGLPGSSTNLSARAVPNHPGEPDDCSCPLLHRRCWLHPLRKTGHSH